MPQANAMTVATVDGRGRPSARVVLLKGYDRSGFVFYTNLESRKSEELAGQPAGGLLLSLAGAAPARSGSRGRWRRSAMQSLMGTSPRVPAAPGSRPLLPRRAGRYPTRAALERLVTGKEAEFEDGEVPRPAHWGGWRVRPERFEFWQGRRHRLHDRVVYLAEGGGWRKARLAP